jgi:hypothetical protein
MLGAAANFLAATAASYSRFYQSLHIQMICPLLAARTDGCPRADRSLNVPEIFQSAPWNDQWLEADLAEACAWVRGSKLAPRWKFVL